MFVYLIAIAIILFVIHLLFNYNEKARLLKKIPGPRDTFIVGNLPEIITISAVDIMKLGRTFAKQWNGIYRFWSFPLGAVNIYNPDDIEVMISNTKFNQKSVIYSFLKPWLGDGLLLSYGDKWQQRRKILTPAFHFNILRQFCIIIEENSRRLVEELHNTSGKPIDIVPVLSEYALNSICAPTNTSFTWTPLLAMLDTWLERHIFSISSAVLCRTGQETAMGTQLSEEATGAGRSYKKAIYDLVELFYQRFIKLYLYPDIIFSLSRLGMKMKVHTKTLHNFTEKVVNDRKDYIEKYGVPISDDIDLDDGPYIKKKKTAMLDLLLTTEKEGAIDRQGIQEEVDTFMFEGHDTTASGLTFCFMLLANNKHIQDKIVEELNEIFGDSPRSANMQDLSKMKYVECCIKESLRLYPPVHFISRNVTEPVTLSNYVVPAGTFCHIHIFDLHRRADLYKDPTVFDPDRFLQENCVGRHPYAYIPFSAGPRNCIGQKFAMMEMKSAVSEVLRKFELLPHTHPSDIEFKADLVLRNSGPVKVTFVKRF